MRRSLPVDYSKVNTPADYKCDVCGATGCKLWRESHTFANYTKLLCCDCAARDQKKDIGDIDSEGRYTGKYGKSDQIGLFVPAVPTEDGDTYWGYTTVPQAGCNWWNRLPTRTGA